MHHQYIIRVSIIGFISVLSIFVFIAAIFFSLNRNELIINRKEIEFFYFLTPIKATLPLVCSLDISKEKQKIFVIASTLSTSNELSRVVRKLEKYRHSFSFLLVLTMPFYFFLTPMFSKKFIDLKVYAFATVYGSFISFGLIALLSYKTIQNLAPHLNLIIIENKQMIIESPSLAKKLEKQNYVLNNLLAQEKTQLFLHWDYPFIT